MLPKYKILTSKSVLNIPYDSDSQYEKECDELVTEQYEIVGNKLNFLNIYRIHFFDSPYTSETVRELYIFGAIEHLAIKDGYDLVQYENGNYGYVAYYNGIENGFEILEEESYE